MSKYPIGAIWIGKEKNSPFRIGTIWLEERRKYHEFWRWNWIYSDGSAPISASDWGTSYRMCRNMMVLRCRMKRVI